MCAVGYKWEQKMCHLAGVEERRGGGGGGGGEYSSLVMVEPFSVRMNGWRPGRS